MSPTPKPSTRALATRLWITLSVLLLSFWVGLSAADAHAQSTGGSLATPFAGVLTSERDILNTALRLAAREGRTREMQRVLDQGADPNAAGEFGETALLYAARFGQIKAVELLLERGAEPNQRDDHDNSPLIQASKNCSPRVARQLLDARADVNWTNHEGRSALIYAARDGCVPIVQMLLGTRGIKVNLKDDGPKTALDYALEEAIAEVDGKYTQTVAALRAAGARTLSFVEADQELRKQLAEERRREPVPTARERAP